MGLTLEQLKAQGATPSQGISGGQLKSAGATPSTGFFKDSSAFDSSQAALGHSQGIMDKIGAFASNVNTGIAKSAGSALMSAGAQHAGPIGADMAAHAPEWNQYMQQGEAAMQPEGTGQQIGNVVGQGMQAATGAEGAVATAKLIPGIIDAVKAEGIGGVLKNGLSGAMKLFKSYAEQKADKKSIDIAQKSITPRLTSGETQQANITTPKRGAPYVDMSADKAHMERANAVKGLVTGKDNNLDLKAVENRITDVAEKETKPFLSANKVPFNFEDLQNKMKLTTVPDNLKGAPNTAARAAWDHARETMMQHLHGFMQGAATKEGDFTNTTDLNNVWDAFKSATDKAERELKFDFGTPQYSGTKAAVQQFRTDGYQAIEDSLKYPGQMEQVNKAEEFIKHAKGTGIQIGSPEQAKALIEQMGITTDSESIAKAAFFKNKISELKNLYGARDNLRTWLPNYLEENKTFGQRHPNVKVAAQVAGAGVVGSGAVGVAGAVKDKLGL